MRQLIAAVALFALASSAVAADVVLGPETPVSAPALDAAAGDQVRPSLAWYGDSLATSWIDIRRGYSDVRIAQLDALGRPKGIAARAYGSIDEARLAANGAGTPLIATANFGQTAIGPAGFSGRLISGSLGDLVTNGSSYLLVTLAEHTTADILDGRGDAIVSADLGETAGNHAVAVPLGSAYHVVFVQNDCGIDCFPAIHDAIVREDGSVSDQTIVSRIQPGTHFAAAAAGDRLLIAWTTMDSIELFVLTPSRMLVNHTSISVRAQKLFAGSDGNKFLIAWNDSTALRATRVTSNGVTEGVPFTLGSALASDLTFARTPAGIVLGWSDSDPANVFTRGAANLDAIVVAPNVLASIGYAQQQDLDLETGIAVWSEGETGSSIVSTRGKVAEGHNLRHPAAAQGAGSTLIAWLDGSRVVARFNDDAPLVVAEAETINDLDVAFDGASFFVVWSDGELHKTRFASSGAKLETTTIESTGHVTSLRAARVGNKLAVAFADGNTIAYAGDTTRPIGIVNSTPSRPAIGIDDQNQPFVVWSAFSSKPCIFSGRRVDDALFVVTPVVCSTSFPNAPAVAWSGTEFVIAWHEERFGDYRTIRALRATRTGSAIDAQPFDLTGVFRDSFGAAVVPSATGVTIGYQRVAGEEPFDDVSRIFTRTLVRLGGVVRGRASR